MIVRSIYIYIYIILEKEWKLKLINLSHRLPPLRISDMIIHLSFRFRPEKQDFDGRNADWLQTGSCHRPCPAPDNHRRT